MYIATYMRKYSAVSTYVLVSTCGMFVVDADDVSAASSVIGSNLISIIVPWPRLFLYFDIYCSI